MWDKKLYYVESKIPNRNRLVYTYIELFTYVYYVLLINFDFISYTYEDLVFIIIIIIIIINSFYTVY